MEQMEARPNVKKVYADQDRTLSEVKQKLDKQIKRTILNNNQSALIFFIKRLLNINDLYMLTGFQETQLLRSC